MGWEASPPAAGGGQQFIAPMGRLSGLGAAAPGFDIQGATYVQNSSRRGRRMFRGSEASRQIWTVGNVVQRNSW